MNNPPLLLKAALTLEAKAAKPARLQIRAYSGGLMDVAGWGGVVIAFDGLKLPDAVPLLADHQNVLAAVVGQGRPEVRGGQLIVTATLADSEAAKAVQALLGSGVELAASVGVKPETTKRLPEGQHTVNGQTLAIPARGATLVVTGTLREISILPIGADDSTQVSLAARRAAQHTGDGNMPDTKTADDIRAAERERLMAIDNACQGFGDNSHVKELRAKAIAGELSVETLQGAVLEILRATRNAGPLISTHGAESGATSKDVLAAAILLHAGRRDVAEKELGPQLAQQGEDLRCRSLLDICAAACLQELGHVPVSRQETIRAAFSSSSLPIALGDSASKIALQDYKQASASWRSFCDIVSVGNFREHQQIRVNWAGGFQPVGSGGELKHGSLTESTYTIQADTFGELFVMTRQNIIDDNLGLLASAGRALGRASAKAISDAIWTLILANTGDHFHADNNNYIEGADTALSVTSLGEAIQALRKQVDADGKPIDLQPKTLAVPPELESTARALLSSVSLARYVATGGVDLLPEGSPVPKDLQLEIEPRMSLTTITGYSVVAWLLFSAAQDAPFSVAFLNGVQNPTVEVIDLPGDVLGVGWRGYLDFGVGQGDPAAGVKSKGA